MACAFAYLVRFRLSVFSFTGPFGSWVAVFVGLPDLRVREKGVSNETFPAFFGLGSFRFANELVNVEVTPFACGLFLRLLLSVTTRYGTERDRGYRW